MGRAQAIVHAKEVAALRAERDEALTEHIDMMWQRRRADERAEAAEAARDALLALVAKMRGYVSHHTLPGLITGADELVAEADRLLSRLHEDGRAGKGMER